MARPLRIQYPGAFYHVTSRGNEQKAIFRSNSDRERFLSYLESAREIGAYYGMRGSAVSQCSRRFKQKVLEDKKLKKAMAEIARKTGLVEC